MNTTTCKILYSTACCLSLLLWSCENNRPADTNNEISVDSRDPNDTIQVVRTGKTAEDRLEEMRNWMRERTSTGDTIVVETTETREEFKRRTAELDARVDSLSEKSKAEYQQLKSRYNNWETRQQRRQQEPLQPERIKNVQEDLLREHKDLNKVTPQNLREAYLTFMGTVRAKKQNWTQDDWDYVDHVYSRLNQRKREIDGQLSTTDKLKIKALQAEYLTMEGVADTQSMIGTMRD